MKTIKKIISLALSALFVLGAVSCKKEETQAPESENVTALSKVENDYRVELCNFEQWKPDFSLIRVLEYFGQVSRNKDTNYVKSGKYSAKLQPLGGYYTYKKPVMYYPLASTHYEFNYEDFSYVDYVEFWMYNDEDTVQSMNVGLVSKITNKFNIEKYPAETFYLQPKQWNLITYYIDFSAMAITQKLSANALMQVKGVYFEFNSTSSKDVADAPVFYMDDLNLYYKEEPNNTQVDVNQLIRFNHKEGTDVYELCDFEHVYQKHIFTTKVNDPKSDPTISIVSAASQGLDGFKATSGKNVLRIEMKGADKYKGSTSEYTLSSEIVRAFYDQFVYDYDTGTDIIPVEEWGDYYLAYDVYATKDFEEDYYFGQFIYDGDNTSYCRSNPSSVYVKNGEWVTKRVSLAEIADYTKSRRPTEGTSAYAGVKKAYEAYQAHYEANGGRGRRISDAGQITFYWPEFVGENRVMYLDNIRVYKATV